MAAGTCQAISCQRVVPKGKLMCDACWQLVPLEIKRRILAAYVVGAHYQSKAYATAVWDAVLAVREAKLQKA